MRKLALAVMFTASVSPVFAASDLVVDSTKADLFYDGTPMSLVMAGYVVPSGTGYILNSTSSKFSALLDASPQWSISGMPTGSTSVGNLKYIGAYPGIQEGTIAPPQCVAFTKVMTNTGGTLVSSWAKGIKVSAATTASQLQNKAIATFNGTNGAYGGHTAILLSPEFSGGKLVAAWVVDQNYDSDGRIKKRKMTVGTATQNASSMWDLRNYYVVQK